LEKIGKGDRESSDANTSGRGRGVRELLKAIRSIGEESLKGRVSTQQGGSEKREKLSELF